jgi:hypothetical protein
MSPVRALEFYCGIGPWFISLPSAFHCNSIDKGGCTLRLPGAPSATMQPLFAPLIGTKPLALSMQRTMVLASYTGYVFLSLLDVRLLLLTVDHLQVDINSLTADALEPLDANLWLLSPACQPYTVLNPNAKGAADPRAQSFLHLMEEVLPALTQRGAAPTRLLIENVAGFEVRCCALSSCSPLNDSWETGVYNANSRAGCSQKTGLRYPRVSPDTAAIQRAQFAIAILSLGLTG